ncbi:hypothetical protein [Pseudogracilibacillus sp. ICA-222130]|uniref:hypothetical protein n=1 Tax=Pseudogracilibacillus sp. ICA-222130 TaxID=3134655 RepID=UPI0030BA7E20
MITATLTIGAILSAALLIVSLILVKATPKKSYVAYYPGFLFFAAGLILLLFATILDSKVTVYGDAGLGGLGIACLFAAAVSTMVAAVVDAYRQVA